MFQTLPGATSFISFTNSVNDLRNHLNAIELQSAYISELERDDELKSEIKRLRVMISGLTSTLQSLSKAVSVVKPNLILYPAADFVEDLREKINRDFSAETAEINWKIQLGDAMLNVDPQLVQETFIELFANAFRHNRGKGVLVATARQITTNSSLRSRSRKPDLTCPPRIGAASRFGKSARAITVLV